MRHILNRKHILNRNIDEIRKLKRPIDRLIRRTRILSPIINEDPDYAIPILKRRVKRFSGIFRIRVYAFKIGRTANPESRKNQKINGNKPDAWIVLYASDNLNHVFEVEEELNKRFHKDPKCANIAPGAGGGTSTSEENCVYLAVVIE